MKIKSAIFLTEIKEFFLNKKNYYIYFGSNILYNLVPILLLPVISRIYDPEVISNYSLIIGASIIFSNFSSLALENTIYIEKKYENQQYTLLIPIFISFLLNLIIYIFLFIYTKSNFSHSDQNFILFIPLISWIYNIYRTFKNFVIRYKKINIITYCKLIFSTLLASLSLLLGIYGYGTSGLIYSLIITNTVVTIYLISQVNKYIDLKINFLKFFFTTKRFLKKYISYIFWTNPSNIMSTSNNFITIFLIGKFYGLYILGQYVFATKVMEFPLSILSSTIQDIFIKNSTNEIENNGNAKITFIRFLLLNLFIATFFLFPFYLIFPKFIPIVFGAKWIDSVILVKSTIILVYFRFISSPLSMIWIIRKKEKYNFYWQMINLLLGVTSICLVQFMNKSISLSNLLIIHSLVVSFWYIVAILGSYLFSKIQKT